MSIDIDIRFEVERPQQVHGVEILGVVGRYHEKLKSGSSRTIELWARYIPGQILCRTQVSRQKKTNAKLTRPKPKEKVGFKWLPSTPGFVPFSDNRYRSGTKSSGLS
jgi:hypothetical protein